ncbi:unnamed protein product [Candidula unifasciata]|uniref:G-protein coupled receptors family 1 profile domain-containing protein n=1 Tax=Candidula unifasciata TaxID=100452 RepID=A0A8S3Z749_9EUPU|nr:unnamed protein product [Candidula unifasciata]
MDGNITYLCVHHFTIGGLPLQFFSIPFGVLVLFQNLLTIIIIHRTPKLHTHANIVLASIACGDIYLALVYIGDGIIYLPGVRNTMRPNPFLEASTCGAGYSSLLLSVSQLGFIAVDRYIHIVNPLYYIAHITKRRVYTIIACFWIVGLVYGIIPVIMYRSTSNDNICLIARPPFEYIVVPVVLYHVEIVLMFVCYFRIARLAFQRKKASHARQLGLNGDTLNRENFNHSRVAAWKSVTFFATMCGIFVVCTYPAVLAILISSVDSFPLSVFMPLMFLFLIHSVLNFFVYFNMNKDFCQGFKKIIADIQHKFMKTNTRNGN